MTEQLNSIFIEQAVMDLKLKNNKLITDMPSYAAAAIFAA